MPENISFFDPQHEQSRAESAARLAAVHEEIAAMPMGYESLIGDLGSSLSGGQKQRIMLARALYRQPRLLLLDEATSHLDMRAERLVSAAIAGLQLTRLIVAHRPRPSPAATACCCCAREGSRRSCATSAAARWPRPARKA